MTFIDHFIPMYMHHLQLHNSYNKICIQKKHYIMCHITFAAICKNFMNTVSFTILLIILTLIYAANNSQHVLATFPNIVTYMTR